MELYDAVSKEEKKLRDKADATNTPIGGTFELTPLCNMDCRMCYVRLSKEQRDNQGRELHADEWVRIAKEGADKGLLFILLTGGEPLIYPGFKELYKELRAMGMICSVNTNGTLINEEWADFFAREGVRRVNITLYGKDDKTYENLCRYGKGYSALRSGLKLLNENKIQFRLTTSLTPENITGLPEFFKIAEEFNAPLVPASYMFPTVRREDGARESRLSPAEAAKAVVDSYNLRYPDTDKSQAAFQTLMMTTLPSKSTIDGFPCHAGHSGFWVDWKGTMLPCGMFDKPGISLTDHSFGEGWDFIVEKTRQMKMCAECADCNLSNICQVCPASCLAENGDTSKKPEYVCEMTKEMVAMMERTCGRSVDEMSRLEIIKEI